MPINMFFSKAAGRETWEKRKLSLRIRFWRSDLNIRCVWNCGKNLRNEFAKRIRCEPAICEMKH